MDHARRQDLLIGDCRIAPHERRLEGPGGTRHLCSQTIALLELFAEHPGEIVRRGEIIDHVCRGHHHPEKAVTRCVSELRRCLGDDSHHPRYIQTVAGEGYRLIASVSVERRTGDWAVVDEPTPAGRLGALLTELRQRKVCRAALLYMLVVWLLYQIAEIVIPALKLPEWTLTLVVLLGIFGFPLVVVLAWALEVTPQGLVIDLPRAQRAPLGRSTRGELLMTASMLVCAAAISVQLACASLGVEFSPVADDATPRIQALAVGDFVAAGPGPQSEALSHGVVDELRRLLLESGQVHVMAAPRSSVASLRDLSADALLEGSVNVEAGRVRATVHLVDPATGYDLWSIALEDVEGSAAALQERLAQQIAARLPIPGVGSLVATGPANGGTRFAQVADTMTNDLSGLDGT